MEEDTSIISREWIYSKILDSCQKKYYGKLCGIVLAGGPGAGKTTFCHKLQQSKVGSRKQTMLQKKLLASFICPEKGKGKGNSVVQFLHSMYAQLGDSSTIQRFSMQENNSWLRDAVDDPDDVFKRIILFPLLESEVNQNVVILLVDGLDLDLIVATPGDPDRPSNSIPELLSRHCHLLPRWLLPVFTTRQSTAITTHFPGFRRISIDDLRKTQVIQDIQQFILVRLQNDQSISRQITKDSTDLLSLLHVKSAGCFLYIKKVLDGISECYINLEEIRDIPGTLNGLYLWLCQKQFNKKNFPKIRPLINILLVNESISESELYKVTSAISYVSSLVEFQRLLLQLRPLLTANSLQKPSNVSHDNHSRTHSISLFHPSLCEWFTLSKFCGPVFECSREAGLAALDQWKSTKEIKSPEEEEDWTLLTEEEGVMEPESKVEKEKERSLVDCVREDDLTLLARMLKIQEEPKEREAASLVAAREGFLEALKILLDVGEVNQDATDENGWTILRTAAWSGQNACVRLLLESGSKVNKTDSDSRTALRAACWAGHLDCVSLLLEQGAAVNQMDGEGRTALVAACYMGHTEAARELLVWGADVEIQDQDGRTALSVAVTCESESASKLVHLLLEHQANPNQADRDGLTPLLIAAFEGKFNVCEILLENGADVDHTDKEGKSALFGAASMGHLDILQLLLFWGCYVDGIDSEGRTVLSVAAAEGSAPLVQALLDRGLDEQHRDNAGWGPLHYAAFEGHAIVCCMLANAGANVDMTDCDGKTALHLACTEGHYDVVVQLLRSGADVNIVTLQGRTPLRIALLENCLDIAGLLLDNGANIDHVDSDSRSSLYIMALEADAKCVEFLLNHGANTELKDADGRSALHVAAWQGYTDIVQVLLLNGADVNSLDGGDRSSLLSACWQGHLHIVDILLTAGAEVNKQCCQGASPLAVAAQEGHLDVLKLLIQHGADPLQQDLHGRDPYRVALRNNNSAVAEILEKQIKRLSNYREVDNFSKLKMIDDDPESPLYASPTAYGYAKVGPRRSKSSTPGNDVSAASTSNEEVLNKSSFNESNPSFESTADWNTQEETPEKSIVPSEFTFSQTGHMAIILGRGEMAEHPQKTNQGIFGNIRAKAKNGFGTKKIFQN